MFSLGAGSFETILLNFFFLSAEFVLLWSMASQIHTYSFSALHLFLLSELIFFCIMPFFAVVSEYRFLLEDNESRGIGIFMMLNFWLVLIYYASYRLVIGGTQKGVSYSSFNFLQYERQIIVASAVLAVVLGLVSLTTVYVKLGDLQNLNYESIGLALRGEGWSIRMGELLALGGILIFLVGKVEGSRFFIYLGLSVVCLYAFLRLPFQNRENVIKYFVVLFFLTQVLAERSLPTRKIFFMFSLLGFLLVILPLLSAIRGGWELSELGDIYNFFLFRDLNFSEVPSKLLASGEYAGFVGWWESITKSVGMLVPRQFWPDKPFPIAVDITSWVTPVENYEVDNPTFAYAPTYIGWGYVIGGVPFVFVIITLLGVLTGLFARRCRVHGRKKAFRHLDLVMYSLIAYHGTIAVHKLDPANIITSLILPVSFLVTVKIVLFFASFAKLNSSITINEHRLSGARL